MRTSKTWFWHPGNSQRTTIFRNYLFKSIRMEKKSERLTNTEEEHEEAVAGEDPTRVSREDLQDFAREAVKKFKSMG